MIPLEHYIQVGQKKLRCGVTTGACAAAAARAAAELLLTGSAPSVVRLLTPSGVEVAVEVEEAQRGGQSACCTVHKDAGDDPDITDGMPIVVTVSRLERGIEIDGGTGVGRVTRPGLDQPVGAAAINSTPRTMIRAQMEEAARSCGYSGGFRAVVSLPEGAALAGKTFNPRLGIEGGLSVLGTSGIVRPMSETALIASIQTEIDMLRAEGVRHLLASPGNYGADFCRDALGLSLERAVQCSNYIGVLVDYAVSSGFSSLLLVGHVGKLVKCAAGVMNTHSRVADGRMEVLAAHAGRLGADRKLICGIFDAATTDGALELLREAGLLEPVMQSVTQAAHSHLTRRAGESMPVEVVIFSNRFGLLGMSGGADSLLAMHREER